MTKKERELKINWLSRINKIDMKIDAIETEITKWKARKFKITPNPEYFPEFSSPYLVGRVRGSYATSYALEDAIERLEKLEKERLSLLSERDIMEKEIKLELKKLEEVNYTASITLYYKYLHGMTYQEIADKINYCTRSVQRYHDKGLELIAIPQAIKKNAIAIKV